MPETKQSVLGISFDGVAMSGLIAEFLKVAHFFHAEGYETYLNLGYDIKADKGNFFRKTANEKNLLPAWVELCDFELDVLKGRYNEEFVSSILDAYVTRDLDIPIDVNAQIEELSDAIADALVNKFNELNVAYLIVENGTLPENIIFTSALYKAIERYGVASKLGKYVFWRDHDLMQTSEPLGAKYGAFPYKNVPKPKRSNFIQYIVQHDFNRRHLVSWANVSNISVIPNCFSMERKMPTLKNSSSRSAFGIPENAFLIAHCTRIIPQKRIDRELYLLSELMKRLPQKDIYLFVTGDPAENPAESEKLIAYANQLGISKQVVFGGCFPTFDSDFLNGTKSEGFTVWDILANADLSSFLTSYDYESYGNPIGEAIAAGVPYLTSTYSLYDDVYGRSGFQGILMKTSKDHDGMPEPEFVNEVAEAIANPRQLKQIAEKNFELGKQLLSMEFLNGKIRAFLKTSRSNRSKKTVVQRYSASV
ncbi:MAG: glycosyltransferase family 4 protein [Myxococcales bacterium]|nr:MAG: glycosyltransferase family 4 protein [Myxococcales bacterium]